jgi:hypothetical protein
VAGLWGRGLEEAVLRACIKTETTSSLPPHLPVSMTTRGLEDLDGGLGSCLPSDDLPFLEEPASGRRPESKARGTVTEDHLADLDWNP